MSSPGWSLRRVSAARTTAVTASSLDRMPISRANVRRDSRWVITTCQHQRSVPRYCTRFRRSAATMPNRNNRCCTGRARSSETDAKPICAAPEVATDAQPSVANSRLRNRASWSFGNSYTARGTCFVCELVPANPWWRTSSSTPLVPGAHPRPPLNRYSPGRPAGTSRVPTASAHRRASSTITSERFVNLTLPFRPSPTVRVPSPSRRPSKETSCSGSGVAPNTGSSRGTAIRSPTASSESGCHPEIVRNGWVSVHRTVRPRAVVTRNTGLRPSSMWSEGTATVSWRSSPRAKTGWVTPSRPRR